MVTMIRNDLDFILAQIKIAEADAQGIDVVANGMIPNPELPWGLRRIDGSNNNLGPDGANYGAADQPFPRATTPTYVNEGDDAMRFGPPISGPTGPINFGFAGVPAGYISQAVWDLPLNPDGTRTSPNGTIIPAGTQPNYLNNNNYADHDRNDPAITSSRAIQPGDVVDADPRIISNLIADQTLGNPAAVYKALLVAGYADNPNTPHNEVIEKWKSVNLAVSELKNARIANDIPRIEAATAAVEAIVNDPEYPLAIDLSTISDDILKATLVIKSVAPDAGLSSPLNGFMTLFGQFFDHGLDLVTKGGYGTVYIPLQPDDPLYVPGGNTNFMAVTRATLDENGREINQVTPFVDQNQTYTSNASAQVFHREYILNSEGKPQATGRLLNGESGGLANWAEIKAQAKNILGIELNDLDIHNVPELVVDPYGNFIPGTNGFPQLVRSMAGGAVEAESGTPSQPVRTIDGSVSTGHAFLDDIAHSASPSATKFADADNVIGITTEPNPAFNPLHAGAETFLLERTANVVANPNFDNTQPPSATNPEFLRTSAFYDNELLDRHFVTGDGRGNENIGLTAIHNVFHAEHNRQVELIKDTIVLDGDLAFINEWLHTGSQLTQTQLDAILALPEAERADAIDALNWNGERIFQAAKFPTEMQYQHLVFEEFARTVQPFVNVFNDYNGQLNPAILGEFAHTVYRFGHSQLRETVDRLDENGNPIGSGGIAGADQEQIGLIEAFLNPVEFTAGGMSAEEMTAAIARGMTRQVGQEIDEFVTESLRNNLLGLPLDLAAINMARGRELGVPTLNQARAEFFAGSGDTQIKPYESWAEFALKLKNPASIINFVAAYGTHASIVAAGTAADKRDAAMKLVMGDPSLTGQAAADFNADRLDFLNARGIYAGGSLGGLNNVDFWIGGLAEKQMAFGGFLGTTFNFVFEVQLENLQNGDRFYYLSRLANLNLTAQLENNKFAEMIDRNVDGLPLHLPGNVFKAMDYQLEADISRQVGDDPTGPAYDDAFLGSILGDTKVIRADLFDAVTNPDGGKMLRFIGGEHVVLGGTDKNDILIGDEGDDTLWGDDGDDRLEGGIGNDFVFGGEGNDIITDEFGDDEIRSGGGDDVVSAGQGLNLIITDTGRDFVWGGDDLDEMLLGQGDDFGAGGADADMLIGGEGNDWLESGLDNGLMLGDNGDLIQGLPIKRSVDSSIVGHDVLVATGGNADFDAESGNDIMVGGLGTDRFFGQFGFDWATYKNDPYGIEADMNNRLFAPPNVAASPGAILDRYSQTEALSGSAHIDFLRGDSEDDLGAGLVPAVGGVTATALLNPGLDNALKDIDVALVDGLDAFLGNINEAGENRFSAGNILLGGGGSDVIEGRGGNDLIDGDRWLNVAISVRDPNDHSVELFRVEGMKDIQERMFSGEIKVSQLEIVREIITDGSRAIGPNGRGDVDVAQFSGPRDDYRIGYNIDGSVTITHLVRDATGAIVPGLIGIDGVDRLTNIERALFSDQTIKLFEHANEIATGAATISFDPTGLTDPATPEVGTVLNATLGTIADVDGLPLLPNGDVDFSKVNVYWQVEATPLSGVFTNITRIVGDETAPVTGPTFTLTAAEAGLNVRVKVQFVDGDGAVETVNSPAIGIGAAGAGAGLPVVPDPAAILGDTLPAVGPDGIPVDPADFAPGAPIGIFEDSGAFTITRAALLENVVDPDTPPEALNVFGLVVRTRAGDPVPGTLAITNDQLGNFVSAAFTPAPDFNGGVTFTYEVSDGFNLVPAEAVLEVIPVNDVPAVVPAVVGQTLAGAARQPVNFTIASLFSATPTFDPARGTATDIDGDRMAIDPATVRLANPAQGVLTLNAATGVFTFVPNAGFNGPVTLNFTVADNSGATNGSASSRGTATILVSNAAATGTVAMTDMSPTESVQLGFTTATIADVNGSGPYSYQWQSSSDGGATWSNITGATDRNFTPTQAEVGLLLRVRLQFTDGGGHLETLYGTTTTVVGDNITSDAASISGTAGDDIVNGGTSANIISTFAGDDRIVGNAGNDVIYAGDGNDSINAGVGSDSVYAGAGDDVITHTIGRGRDFYDGGENATPGDTDTFVLTGTVFSETFRIYTRNAFLSVDPAAALNPNTEIVITRTFLGMTSIIAELDNIEEITVNGSPRTAGGIFGGLVGGDRLEVFGDFSETSLNLNTIKIGGMGAVDITGLDSTHRIVVRAQGELRIVGAMRSQDVIVLPAGVDPATVTSITANGVTTLSTSAGTISFTGAMPLVLGANQPVPEDTQPGGTSPSAAQAAEGPVAPVASATEPVAAAPATNSVAPVSAPLEGVLFAGTAAADTWFGSAGNDSVNGGAGDDYLFGHGGDDILIGGDGNDVIDAGDGADQIFGGAGDDRILGGTGDDSITGGSGRDIVTAGAGNDVIFATGGDVGNVYDGGEGSDTINYSAIDRAMLIDLGNDLAAAGGIVDHIASIENVVGGAGNDTIYAGTEANQLDGGLGDDVFIFTSAAHADGDTISGFQAGDRIMLNLDGATAVENGTTFDAAGQYRIVHVDDNTTHIEINTDGQADVDALLVIHGQLVTKDQIN